MSPVGGDADAKPSRRRPVAAPRRHDATGSDTDSPSKYLDYSDVLDDNGEELGSEGEESGGLRSRILEQVARMYAATQGRQDSRRNLRTTGRRDSRMSESAGASEHAAAAHLSETDGSSDFSSSGEDDHSRCAMCHNTGHTSRQCPLWKTTPGSE